MECKGCAQDSVMRPKDMAIDDEDDGVIIIYWSCPVCGALHDITVDSRESWRLT